MRSFFENLLRLAASAGGQPAVVGRNGTVSYAELIGRVRGVAHWAGLLPPRIGLLFDKTVDAIIADLGMSFAGKELVPLPSFFSDAQLSHIVRVAALTHSVVDPSMATRARRLGLNVSELGCEVVPGVEPAPDASRIIFTSGTTGNPKGVCLSGRQVLASTVALAAVTGATSADRYLSVLPGALLLEQTAGTYLPLGVGAQIHLLGNLVPGAITQAAEEAGATATVLVPELLEVWTQELRTSRRRGPDSLRYVAVGGAPVSTRLSDTAWAQGLPAHEGYGLSECCSVVAVNRPGERRRGTVGPPLPGINVAIHDGEITVSGPTVMNGYLNELPTASTFRTGDLGHFDRDGSLVVTGRKDNVVVTNAGRNISPEWIEEMIGADHRIKRCVVVGHEGELVAVLVVKDDVAPEDANWLDNLIRHALRNAPEYAKPRQYLMLSDVEFQDLGLLTANLRPRRPKIADTVADQASRLASPTI